MAPEKRRRSDQSDAAKSHRVPLRDVPTRNEVRQQIGVVLVALLVCVTVAVTVIFFETVYDNWHWSDRIFRF